MNTPAPDSFRGSRAVADVIARLAPLAERLQPNRSKVITLSRHDLDVLRRYPAAAQALHDVTTSDGGVTYWRGFELRSAR